DNMLNSQHWYSSVLRDAVAAKFTSATEFFDALKQAEPAGKDIPTFDDTELDPYRHAINHARQYPEDDGFQFQVETIDKEV
ncbi:hypothetical protein ACP0G4_28630, partial [Escherichia coli]